MENYFFSENTNSFYPSSLKQSYINAKTWPTDAIQVDNSIFIEFTATPPHGKIRGSNGGVPVWINLPAPPHSELVACADIKKSQLKGAADSEIDWRQDAVGGGYAEDHEIAELAAWKKYRVLLMRIDTSKAPDIDWPRKPE
ncbi:MULTISPECIES: tail fiber assembly protein [Yersinia pseudotuberculosis complex]|uniref:tail fiber assembly protein n=1 Tax=Yersinia pseudotuberculosis complex TaxID=1649845 RepID=UPI00061BE79C|nr:MULTISPECIES: tail fiber assembly protein [Yersinia pseudotuberculosis complex]MBO1551460.1 hypothetical protein [Yersinia pseudotuberculosis]MBO1571670.1 hypothetical protein [Yersinia pseudotuberculosis]MBO1586571.1 hypothetical protein [Yersinia pseudotuberculosis]MBO1636163.1 hypothetical protein [Yersinia pseudotuberculosis]CNB99859.1 tail assembly chaperone gp38 [Yersinia similis]